MKHFPVVLSLAAALSLSLPATGLSRDHHHQHRGGHGSDRHRDSRSGAYCPPRVSYQSHRPFGYAYAPSYYSGYPYGYGAYPYSYSRPYLDVSIASGPRYASYARTSGAVGYDDDLAEDVQRALARRGYYRGAIDGEIGAGTRGAIRSYQYRHQLEVTGRIDRSLLRSLGLA